MPDRGLQLTRIEVENFKRFERLELDLESFNLLVGPNNSGKSTVLQACQLFDFCYFASRQAGGGKLHFARAVRADSDIPVPCAHPGDLWFQRDSLAALTWPPPPLVVTGRFRAGPAYTFRLLAQGLGRVVIESEETNPPPLSDDGFRIISVPGYVGFLPREERRTPAVIQALIAEGQHAAIVRNLLLDLRASPDRWGRFCDLIREIFPQISMQEPRFEAHVDRYISATYWEPGDMVARTLDLFAAGSGFHQFVQIFAAIFSNHATTILLDEPDAHLFSRLQGRLYGVLRLLVDEGHQIMAATHSPELIAAAAPSQIVSFANGTPRRLQVRTEVANMARSLGALENLGLLFIDAYGKVVVVEDKSDEDQLRWWLGSLLPEERWRRLQGRLVFLHAHRRPTGDQANQMLDTIERAFTEQRHLQVRAFVIADRDYLLEEESAAERAKLAGEHFRRLRWHTWQRSEIENYLLAPEALVRLVTERAAADVRPSCDEILAALEVALEQGRDAARERLIDAYSRYNREAKKGWEASTFVRKAEAYLAQRWQGEDRLALCDAKEVVLPALRQTAQQRWRVSLTDRELIQAVTRDDAPPDLLQAVDGLADFLLG